MNPIKNVIRESRHKINVKGRRGKLSLSLSSVPLIYSVKRLPARFVSRKEKRKRESATNRTHVRFVRSLRTQPGDLFLKSIKEICMSNSWGLSYERRGSNSERSPRFLPRSQRG